MAFIVYKGSYVKNHYQIHRLQNKVNKVLLNDLKNIQNQYNNFCKTLEFRGLGENIKKKKLQMEL